MLVDIKTTITVDLKWLMVKVWPRYIGDIDAGDDVPDDFPLLDGDCWKAVIDVDTGKIRDWPEGEERHLFAKVCDAGDYSLFDSDFRMYAHKEDSYVPSMLTRSGSDYIDIKIGTDGIIEGWEEHLNLSEILDAEVWRN